MTNTTAPEPTVMPLVDRAMWMAELPASAFINAFYQWRDVNSCPNAHKILVVGPGQGLVPAVLKWRGFEVTTLDIDKTFAPDHIGSIHNMEMFADQYFDVIIASHVIEHLAATYLDQTLKEVARVSRFALIYLPIPGKKIQLRFKTYGFRDLDRSIGLHFYNPFHKPDGITPRYAQGQHFWEAGRKGYTVKDLVARMSQYFNVLSVYRNPDWLFSQNFVLESKYRRS